MARLIPSAQATVRCRCGLNQYDNRAACRRCGVELHPPPPAEVVDRANGLSLVLRRQLQQPVRIERPEHVSDVSRAIGRIVRGKRLPLMSQREFARRTGISTTLLCLIEGGRTNPSLRVTASMARVLGMPASELLRQAEAEAPHVAVAQLVRFGPRSVTIAEAEERRA